MQLTRATAPGLIAGRHLFYNYPVGNYRVGSRGRTTQEDKVDLMKGVRQRMARPIQRKVKESIPNGTGDGLLATLVGRLTSRPGLAERAYGEGEVFLIKGALFMSGVKMHPSAYKDIGTRWKEDLGQHHYNPNAGQRRPTLVGVLPNRAEVEYILEVGRAVKERLGVDTIPGSQAVLVPPPGAGGLEALKEAGWQGVSLNMEVWDRRLWPGIVPGKAAELPWEGWLEALERAVAIFGKGNVSSVLVAGLEPKTSHREGVEWMAQRGIYGVPIPFTPSPGSPLEGHQTPTAGWHLEVVARDLDIWEKHCLDAHRHSSGGLHYADLATMRLHLRQEKASHPDRDQTGDLRYALAVEGRLPDL